MLYKTLQISDSGKLLNQIDFLADSVQAWLLCGEQYDFTPPTMQRMTNM